VGDLLAVSMAWMDALWDDDAALLWTVRRDRHMSRETAWYALGLLERGDDARAVRALDAVLAQQFPRAGRPFDGTFRRAPEEPDPPDGPVMWLHYDPNWRQFIGTTFAVVLDRHGDRLASELGDRLGASIDAAVEGEDPTRVSPTYANIALLKAWLDAWAGRTGDADAFAQEVADAFDPHGAFLEYNSPTYYGIDLWALALWRTATPRMRQLGPVMEAALWRDVARFYHPGMRTLCGPYDRAYGMDMTTHATPLGLCIWDAVGRDLAPFPDTAGRFRHPHDLCFAPCVAVAGTDVPDDAVPHLRTFEGERRVVRVVTDEPRRVATAWLSDDAMLGGWAGPASGIGWFQHHHATAHWRREDGSVGWLRLEADVPADATVVPGELRITTRTDRPILFEVHPADDRARLVIDTDASPAQAPDERHLAYEPSSGPTTFAIHVRADAPRR
jgi:hypothetical protein